MTKRSSHRHAYELGRKAQAEARRLERLARKAEKRARHKGAPGRTKLGMAAEARVDGVTPP
jgi:hypothetical protein